MGEILDAILTLTKNGVGATKNPLCIKKNKIHTSWFFFCLSHKLMTSVFRKIKSTQRLKKKKKSNGFSKPLLEPHEPRH